MRLVNADLDLRDRWQRVWVQTRIPGHMNAANPSLYVIGPPGSRLYTAAWKLEPGVTPREWRPDPA